MTIQLQKKIRKLNANFWKLKIKAPYEKGSGNICTKGKPVIVRRERERTKLLFQVQFFNLIQC